MSKTMKKNFIDGLPVSYDHNYVLKTEKQCLLCGRDITHKDIETNSVVCAETFDFMHKACVESKGLEIVYAKPGDPTSMVKVTRNTTQE